jgi:hypothetical protein
MSENFNSMGKEHKWKQNNKTFGEKNKDSPHEIAKFFKTLMPKNAD